MDGWMRFGRGRHPAALKFGDCLAYGTAKAFAQPLLCIGDDFPRTDLELVLTCLPTWTSPR
jgi:ribonuclease VapC